MKLLLIILVALICTTAFSAEAPKTVGTVVSVKTGNQKLDEDYNRRVHFCLFENGQHDLLYVGTNYGMWSNGQFELTINGKKVYSGKIPHLVYGGTIIDLGDVLEEQPKSNFRQHITNIKGIFK
jgi:hypothetical protein